MVGGEGENLGSRGEDPGEIHKSVSSFGLNRPDYVTPEGMEVCPVRSPQGWAPICDTGGEIKVLLPTGHPQA